jgi:hypothetical protein
MEEIVLKRVHAFENDCKIANSPHLHGLKSSARIIAIIAKIYFFQYGDCRYYLIVFFSKKPIIISSSFSRKKNEA